MKLNKHTILLYAVTDRAWTIKKTVFEQVELALKGGVTCVQLREKELEEEEFLEEAIQISKLCKKYKVPLIINDNVKIALKCGAEGIHIGQDDLEIRNVRQIVGEQMIIGVSVHTVDEALEAVENGADYLGIGAVFSTNTKHDVSVISHQVLRNICNSVDIPIVAIGGIQKENMHELAGTGVDGVALVSAIFSAKDIERECKQLYKLAETMVNFQKIK